MSQVYYCPKEAPCTLPAPSRVRLSLSSLFPHLAGLRLEQVTLGGETVTLHLDASARFARCPLCTRRSKGVESVYRRPVDDLALAGRRLILRLRVRRFRCG